MPVTIVLVYLLKILLVLMGLPVIPTMGHSRTPHFKFVKCIMCLFADYVTLFVRTPRINSDEFVFDSEMTVAKGQVVIVPQCFKITSVISITLTILHVRPLHIVDLRR